MLRTIPRFVLAASMLVTAAIAKADEPERGNSFKITIAAQIEMVVQGVKQKIDADTELRYTWKRAGNSRTLAFDSMQAKSNVDGKSTMDSSMSRAKFTNTANGKTDEVAFENAPDQLKQILKDSFEAAVCKIEVDDTGKEVKRAVVAGPGAKALIDQGMIANALLFHPPFMPKQNNWSAPAEFSMGNGGYVKGDLSYQKIRKGEGETEVSVSGTMTCDNFQAKDTPVTVKNAKYVVSGRQVHETALAEWASGKWDIDLSFDMLNGEAPLASAKGKMTVKFERLPAKK